MPVGGSGGGPGTTTPLDDDGVDDGGSTASSDGDPSTSGADTAANSQSGGDVDVSTSGSTSTSGGSDSGTSSGPGGETSDDETTAGVGPPVVELQFTEVAALAGIDYDHGDFNMAPNCLIDQVGSGVNGFCIAERMSGAVSVVDYDEDGDYDLYASRIHGDNLLYENDGA